MQNFTISEENYLKAFYHLQEGAAVVSTNAIARRLQTRPASVTDMIKKLNGKKLLNHTPYYGTRLTESGRKAALFIIRRHRLWEFFLQEKLGFTWDEVHDIAEELEHVSSRKLIDKLDAFLGYPSLDPHGDPIPDDKGKIKRDAALALSDAAPGSLVRIVRVTQQTTGMLELLKHKKIGIGTRLEIKKVFSFDGSLEIKIKGITNITISAELAQNLFVQYENV